MPNIEGISKSVIDPYQTVGCQQLMSAFGLEADRQHLLKGQLA
jgi:hypothetical protein